MSNLKKIILIIIGIALLILIFWLLFFGQNNNVNQQKTNNLTTIITPTITPDYYSDDPIKEEVEQAQQEADNYLKTHPLWENLPYKSDQFKISHYIKEMTLVVYVSKDENQEEIKKLVDNWVVSKGINPPNHQIEFRIQN